MTKTTRRMQGRGLCVATLFLSLVALPKGLQAQNIYKCGNSYSQTPCAGASTLNLDDARDAAQKQQSVAATRRDTGLAAALEKDRLAREKTAAARAPVTEPVVANVAPQSNDGVVHKITPKRVRPKHHKPKAFIAQVPGSEKKPPAKKSDQRKTAAPA